MPVDNLVDLLKSRGIETVCYFHTDHFEPWSYDISDESARAVDRMASLARTSPYARKMSLFYSVFVPYRLDNGEGVRDGARVPGDRIAFSSQRSAHQEKLAREVIRPLVASDNHEVHLHVHHEFWTCNTSHFDTPVSRWVNAHSTPEADKARLDLHFRLCKEVIARETDMPFDRWAFIHGNWALNASDPLICHVDNEMAMIMEHGGFGDFTFPAGRSYCDPKMESPFTCLPIELTRAYDDPRADPRPVGLGTGVMQEGRFFIWNSPVKSNFCSLDYYAASNRDLFKTPERIVERWLSKSVAIDGCLFVKTHAHSMKTEYKLNEPDAVIPHCFPDVVITLDCLTRVCDKARVEFRLLTVNEVMAQLNELDRGKTAPKETTIAVKTTSTMDREQLAVDMTLALRNWIYSDPAHQAGAGEFYEVMFSRGRVLQVYEEEILEYLISHFVPGQTQVVEVGVGYGLLSLLLAAAEFDVVAFEGDTARYNGLAHLIATFADRVPAFRANLRAVHGWFPDAFSTDTLARNRRNIFLSTNIVHSMSADNQDRILTAARAFDDVLIDVSRFGVSRYEPGAAESFKDVVTRSLSPVRLALRSAGNEIWHFTPRPEEECSTSQAAASPEAPKAPAESQPSGTALPPHTILRPPYTADGGAAWHIPLPATFHDSTDTDVSPARSPLRLFENGALLGPGHALHDRIRTAGGGLYSFWKSGLWFSTSDGSNPNSNGRVYDIQLVDADANATTSASDDGAR